MLWKYVLFWFIGFVMGGVVAQEIYIKIREHEEHCHYFEEHKLDFKYYDKNK